MRVITYQTTHGAVTHPFLPHQISDVVRRSAAILRLDLCVVASELTVVTAAVGSTVVTTASVLSAAATATAIAAVVILVHVGVLLLSRSVPGHDTLVSLLVTLVSWVECLDGLINVVHHAGVTVQVLLASVISVAVSVQLRVDFVVSEEHVLRVVVDEVALGLVQVQLSNETTDSELLDDLEDIELLIKTSTRLTLQLVLVIIRMAAAEAPWAVEILLAEEPRH